MGFDDAALDIITMGSGIHAISFAKIAVPAARLRTINLIFLVLLLMESFFKKLPFLKNPARSMELPIGQIHPQKNLPKISVKPSIAQETKAPNMIVPALKEVMITISGSILNNTSGDNISFCGKAFGHNI